MPQKLNLNDIFSCLSKHKLLFFPFIATGIIVGTLISFFYTPTYRTTAIISTPHKLDKPLIPFSLTKSFVEALNKEVHEGQIKELTVKLKIRNKISEKIRNITLENPSKTDKPKFIKLTIEVKTKKYDGIITKALVNYLANQKFIKDKIEKERNMILKNLNILKAQIPELSLIAKKTKEKLIKNNGLYIGFNPVDPDISIAKIKKNIELLQYELNNTGNFKLINFYTELSPLSASKKAIIIICTFTGLLSGTIFILLKYCKN
ncbi:Wzz/FepE/Etk N-terminal domain-containing protein [Desulfurobacterium sp.]